MKQNIIELLVINAILSFMLTPGAWRPFDAGAFNYKAVLNPAYVPTTLARLAISMALAGVGAVVLAALDRSIAPAARQRLVATGYRFMMPAILCLPLGAWTFAVLPERGRAFLEGGAPVMLMFLGFGIAGLVILFAAAAAALARRDYAPSVHGAVVMALLALVAFGAMEFVREGVRKPFVIEGLMYSTGVTAAGYEDLDPRANLARTRRDGVLAAAPWALPPGRTPADLAGHALGEAVYRAACLKCHSVDGYNAVRPLVRGWSPETVRRLLDRMDEVKPAMPPFPGTAAEKDALAAYLEALAPRAP